MKILARHIVPNLGFARRCTFTTDDKAFDNEICHASWSDDGEKIWFGLESHNTFSATPDQEVDVVLVSPSPYYAAQREHLEEQHRIFLASRPIRFVSGVHADSVCVTSRAAEGEK